MKKNTLYILPHVLGYGWGEMCIVVQRAMHSGVCTSPISFDDPVIKLKITIGTKPLFFVIKNVENSTLE